MERRAGLVDRTKHGHRLAPLGHLEPLAPSDTAEVPGEVLAQLSDANPLLLHVYTHCSIFCQTFDRPNRSHTISQNFIGPGQVLAELSDAYTVRFHVYTHCSIFGQTLAPLSRP